jgi:hypothetical protein
MLNIPPLVNPQADALPSVVEDIPLSKSKDDAEEVGVNDTPSLNPEKPNVDETKPSPDIETLYMNEMNKTSEAQEGPTASTK